MDRHKKKNLKIIKTFAEDIVEKLKPVTTARQSIALPR